MGRRTGECESMLNGCKWESGLVQCLLVLLQVHSTWNYSFGGFPFSWISHSGAHKQLQFSGSEQLFQLCKTMSIGSHAFDQLAAQFAAASGDCCRAVSGRNKRLCCEWCWYLCCEWYCDCGCAEMEAYKYGGRRGILPAGVFDVTHWNGGAQDSAMQLSLKCKLAASEPLRQLLMLTHPHRLSSVKPDNYWGIGTRGDGVNMLPLLLEQLREALCQDAQLGTEHHNFNRLWPTEELTVNQLNSFTDYHWGAAGDEQLQSGSASATAAAVLWLTYVLCSLMSGV